MTASIKPLFGQAYQEILEKTRQAETRQRRILRYRLLIWCLPWAPPLPFAMVIAYSVLDNGWIHVGLIAAAVCLAFLLTALGMLDYQLKADGKLEQPAESSWMFFMWGLFFATVQLLIVSCLLLLFQVNTLPLTVESPRDGRRACRRLLRPSRWWP